MASEEPPTPSGSAAPPSPPAPAAAPPPPPPEPKKRRASEEEVPVGGKLGQILLFGRFDVTGVVVRDVGMAKYMDVSPVEVPHTGGKHANKPFAKTKMSIVERLINNMMRTEKFTGKKLKAFRAVERAFTIIAERSKENPLQLFCDALTNGAPREEVTRLQYGGISVPKAVDVAPARRLDLALRNICKGALENTGKGRVSIDQALANEILLAAKNDVQSYAVAKKEELERVAASAR